MVLKKKVTVYILIHTEPLLSDDDTKKSVLECDIGVNWQMHVGLEIPMASCMLGIKLTDEGEWSDLNSRN